MVAAVPEDIPTLASISSDAFESDAQTEMKGHGRAPFLMKEYALESLPGEIKNPRIRIIKAIEEETGAIMGFCTWGFRGLAPPDVPEADVDVDRASQQLEQTTHSSPAQVQPASGKEEDEEEKRTRDDPIARLEDLTSRDLKDWQDTIMPEGASCLFIIGLSVSPAFQRRGVGSALLKWGTDLADKHKSYAWVHSSAGAWRAYANAGFKVVRVLDVDLDEYAPVSAPVERYPGGKWGHYVFRYMVYGSCPLLGSAGRE
ncbi:acyl-CoA N-acyltransferase [Immersiella caudata]|uniref:Acyl-CoA N-acyltransferase n=1 Tax=Immersiella caudata TaxID=314043 RepID=A0AA39WFX5_9PEZI|nr:acyl-CoA N-acyltransferase [Immersiella caudata]